MISHRLSRVSETDQILVIDEGHTVKRSTHTDLMVKKIFYNRYTNQFKGTVPLQGSENILPINDILRMKKGS